MRPATFVVTIVCWLLVATACAGTSTDTVLPATVVAEPTEVPTVAPTAAPTAVPTPEPTEAPIVVADEDRVAAAAAALAVSQDPSFEAFDVLESTVDGDEVLLTVCGWTGETVFDAVYDIVFTTTADNDGFVNATQDEVLAGDGDCLNTTLAESVITFIEAYDDFTDDLIREPSLITSDPRVTELLGNEQEAAEIEYYQKLADDGLWWGPPFDATVPLKDAVVAEILWRRFKDVDATVFEVVNCHTNSPDYGLYNDSGLLDDRRSEDADGPHALNFYVLKRDSVAKYGWRMYRNNTIPLANCFYKGDWVESMQDWKPEPVQWQVLPG